MAREFTASSFEYLQVGSSPVSAWPITFGCWWRPANTTTQSEYFYIGATSGNYWLALGSRSDGSNFRARYRYIAATTQEYVWGGILAADTWHHTVARITANDNHDIFTDGSKVDGSIDRNIPANINSVAFGRLGDSSPSNYSDGAVAEAFIYDVALTDAEIASLAAGYSPLFVRPASLQAYWPLIRDEDQDRLGGYDLTAYNTPTILEHPPVIYPAAVFAGFGTAAAAGTEYTQSAAGTLTSSGTIIKQTSVGYTGTLTSAGVLVTLGTFFRALAGTLTSSGNVAKGAAISYAGALTSSGTVAKQTAVSYAGTLTSSGIVNTVGSFFRSLAGTLTNAGALVKETSTSLAGTLTSSGAVTTIKTFLVSLAGTLTSSGTVVKQTIVSYAGTLASAGTIVKDTAVSHAGSLTSSGSLVRKTVTSLAGTLTSAGDLATQFIGGAGLFFQSVAGTLTSSGTLTKMTSVSYAGTLTSAGTVVKGIFLSVAGTLTSAGDLALVRAKLLVGTLTSSGTIAKQTAVSFAGTLTSAGTVAKGLFLSLAGTLASSGIVSTLLNVDVIFRVLTVKARGLSSNLVVKSRDFLLTVIDRGFE